MSNEVNSGMVQKEVETLTLVERAQVGSAIGTGILALTYVSGYLTATSYLGTFGIPADASELFRAKYIYIGFEYWLFVAIFGVCFYAANLLVRLCKVAKADEEEMGWTPRLRQPNKTLFAVRCKFVDWQDHCTSF